MHFAWEDPRFSVFAIFLPEFWMYSEIQAFRERAKPPVPTTMQPSVAAAFDRYPTEVRRHLHDLRRLVLDVADSHDAIGEIEETLKWGEPSYIAKGGSTVRLGMPKTAPQRCAVYFNCNTKLVDTFREIYPSTFSYEGNRAIVFAPGESIDTGALRHCIELALRYHRLKALPLLGA